MHAAGINGTISFGGEAGTDLSVVPGQTPAALEQDYLSVVNVHRSPVTARPPSPRQNPEEPLIPGSAFDLLEDLGELKWGLCNSAAVAGSNCAQRTRDVAVQIPHGQFTDTVLLREGGQLLGVRESENRVTWGVIDSGQRRHPDQRPRLLAGQRQIQRLNWLWVAVAASIAYTPMLSFPGGS